MQLKVKNAINITTEIPSCQHTRLILFATIIDFNEDREFVAINSSDLRSYNLPSKK